MKQIVTTADGTEMITLSYGNGTYTIGDKIITIGGLKDDETVDIEINGDGNINSVYRIPKDAYVIYDGTTYTAPFDDARLSFEEDPCYYVGYTLPEYYVFIDPDGNIKVDTGIQFSEVVRSGKTLCYDDGIQIDGNGSAVNIINRSNRPLNVDGSDGDELAENLYGDTFVNFSNDGVKAASLLSLRGATVYLDEEQSLTTKKPKLCRIVAKKRTRVTIDKDGDSIRIDGSAIIDAHAFNQFPTCDDSDEDEDEDEDWYRAGDRVYAQMKDERALDNVF